MIAQYFPHGLERYLVGGLSIGAGVALPFITLVLLAVTVPVLVLHVVFYKELLFVSFDRETARTLGFTVRWWDLLLYLTLGVSFTRGVAVTGDEPHYLLMAQSLWQEHDLDLRDNLARRDYLPYSAGFDAHARDPIGSLGLENAGVQVESGRIVTNSGMQTSAPHIYAAGDCTGLHAIVHIAIQQGEVAAHNIAHPDQPRAMDYRLAAEVIFTEPQVAQVGLTEKEALRRLEELAPAK